MGVMTGVGWVSVERETASKRDDNRPYELKPASSTEWCADSGPNEPYNLWPPRHDAALAINRYLIRDASGDR